MKIVSELIRTAVVCCVFVPAVLHFCFIILGLFVSSCFVLFCFALMQFVVLPHTFIPSYFFLLSFLNPLPVFLSAFQVFHVAGDVWKRVHTSAKQLSRRDACQWRERGWLRERQWSTMRQWKEGEEVKRGELIFICIVLFISSIIVYIHHFINYCLYSSLFISPAT
jgi:hypothetical protein